MNKQIEEMADDLSECITYAADESGEIDEWSTAFYLTKKNYQKQEWISVEDRLPKVGEEVLVYRRSVNEYAVALYSDTYREFFVGMFAFVNVTHWQSLPQPPKMKGAE